MCGRRPGCTSISSSFWDRLPRGPRTWSARGPPARGGWRRGALVVHRLTLPLERLFDADDLALQARAAIGDLDHGFAFTGSPVESNRSGSESRDGESEQTRRHQGNMKAHGQSPYAGTSPFLQSTSQALFWRRVISAAQSFRPAASERKARHGRRRRDGSNEPEPQHSSGTSACAAAGHEQVDEAFD